MPTAPRSYVTNPRGHIWKLDESGEVDYFAYDGDTHSGPACTVCGYGFCHHCDEDAAIDCPGPTTPEMELERLDRLINELKIKRSEIASRQ